MVLVVLSALGLVAAQHQARKFYSEYEREQTGMHELEVEWGQLQLEQSTWASHARVERSPASAWACVRLPDGTLVVVEVTK